MNDETQGASTPETAPVVEHVENATLAAALDPQVATVTTDGPAVDGVDAWAAALGLHGISAETATTLATNCLRDGYAQGFAACQTEMEQAPASALRHESMFERLEDDVLWAAEEAAYSMSNLVAKANGREPDDGIDAWRKRTGGLRGARHGA